MGWLARLFKATLKEDPEGICLGDEARWEVQGPWDLPAFLRALPLIAPHDAILYLEGGSPTKPLKEFLDARCVPEESRLAKGTIWPKPLVYHLPATPENVQSLADLAENCAEPEVAIHIHVYRDNEVLHEWHDAFSGDPLYISSAIEEEALRTFCDQLALNYRAFEKGAKPLAPADRPARGARGRTS